MKEFAYLDSTASVCGLSQSGASLSTLEYVMPELFILLRCSAHSSAQLVALNLINVGSSAFLWRYAQLRVPPLVWGVSWPGSMPSISNAANVSSSLFLQSLTRSSSLLLTLNWVYVNTSSTLHSHMWLGVSIAVIDYLYLNAFLLIKSFA